MASYWKNLSIADIDYRINSVQNSVSLYPRSHSEYITGVNYLAGIRMARYKRSQEKEDLDKHILHCTEAIFLPSVCRHGCSCNFVRNFYNLAYALLVRSEDFEEPEAANHSIEYLRYLRGLPHRSFDFPRNFITTSLVRALAIKDKSEAGDGTHIIEEMVALCRELPTSDLSAGFPVSAFHSLGEAFVDEVIRGRSVRSLDKVIGCLQDAVKMCPPRSHSVLFALAHAYFFRFQETPSNEDYEEAMKLLERILDPNQPVQCPEPTRVEASTLVAVFAHTRSVTFPGPESREVAISRLRAIHDSSSVDEELRFRFTDALEALTRDRFEQYSLAEDLEGASSYASKIADLPSFQSLGTSGKGFPVSGAVRMSYSMTRVGEEIQHLEELLSITISGTEAHKKCLTRLSGWYQTQFDRTDDISDIEQSIKYSRLSLDATHHSSDLWRSIRLDVLRDGLLLAFEKTGEISYLDESITTCYGILELKSQQDAHFYTVRKLVPFLLTREKLLGRSEDRHEAIRLISVVIDSPHAQEPHRFRLSCKWAIYARSISHPTTLNSYKSSMSSMQKSLLFAPTVSIQHTRLVAMGKICQNMPLDYASYQIDLGRLKGAIEILEQGRTLIWSEMRGLRTQMGQLVEKDSPLAKKFAEINQELEALTMSVTPSGRPEMEDGVAQGRDWTDPFGRLVVEQQKLVEERDALISQIQGQPGLERFLKAPSFTNLRSAAPPLPVAPSSLSTIADGALVS